MLRAGQEKIKLCTAKMEGTATHSIKQVTMTEQGVDKCKEEALVAVTDMVEEQDDEVPSCVRIEGVIETSIMVVAEGPVLVLN